MSFESRIIVAVALMYAVFGVTQYLTTEVFIAPFLLNATLLFLIADSLFIKSLLKNKKVNLGLLSFAVYATTNLFNDQWFMAFLLNFEELSTWFDSRTYHIVRLVGVSFLVLSLLIQLYHLRRSKVWFLVFFLVSTVFVTSLFLETVFAPEITVYLVGGTALLMNYFFFEDEQLPQPFFTVNSLWFLLSLLNLFELLSTGI